MYFTPHPVFLYWNLYVSFTFIVGLVVKESHIIHLSVLYLYNKFRDWVTLVYNFASKNICYDLTESYEYML